MTTIVYKDGKLYADTQFTVVDPSGKMTGAFIGYKINKLGNMTWVGAGSHSLLQLFTSRFDRISWILFGMSFVWSVDPAELVPYANNKISTVVTVGRNTFRIITLIPRSRSIGIGKYRLNWMTVRAKFEVFNKKNVQYATFGSGQDLATHFLERGEEPDVAIKLTAMYDDSTNSIVQIVDCNEGK